MDEVVKVFISLLVVAGILYVATHIMNPSPEEIQAQLCQKICGPYPFKALPDRCLCNVGAEVK